MIINDEYRLAKLAVRKSVELQQEQFLLSCANEVKDHVHVPRISNPEERMGRPLWPKQFEDRLLKLNPDFLFEVIDGNPTHKRLSILDARGKTFLAVYENSLMPERSIPRLREMEVPDPSFTHVDRKDFPKDPDALKPGWRRILIPWGEYKRGWRTVLVRLIQSGVITPQQAEMEFGSDETPEWRQHTGKGEYTTPF